MFGLLTKIVAFLTMTFFLFMSFFLMGLFVIRGKTTNITPLFLLTLCVCVFWLHHHADDILNLTW